MYHHQMIALDRLVPSKSNVRKTGTKDDIGELANSIAIHGLRQNLNVKMNDNHRWEVIAGGRRLKALKQLVKEGLMAKDAEVPCNVLSETDDPTEISLIENAMRLAMHPDDQFEAFHQLVENGMSVEDVAARFGVVPALVTRRLKLALVSPKLRAAFRKDKLTLEQMMAFAVSDDHAKQEEVFEGLKQWNRSAREIKALLTQETIPLTHRLAIFVTAEAYVEAGGAILRDLFDEQNEGYMQDRLLVVTLAQAKLDAATGEVAQEGWKWVKAEIDADWVSYGHVYPQDDEAQEEDSVERPERYSAEDMARAGALIRVGHDGSLSIQRGLVHPDDRKEEQAVQSPKARKEPGDLPASLVRELTAHKTAALRAELAQSPSVALAVMVYTMAERVFDIEGAGSCVAVAFRRERVELLVGETTDCAGHHWMQESEERWAERLPGDAASLFDWCLTQPQDVLLELLAFCVAVSASAVRSTFDRDDAPTLLHASRVAKALSLDMAAHWKPTAESFYGRLNKSTLLHIVEEAKAPVPVRIAEVKRDVAAKHVAKALEGKGWLPLPLRTTPQAVTA